MCWASLSERIFEALSLYLMSFPKPRFREWPNNHDRLENLACYGLHLGYVGARKYQKLVWGIKGWNVFLILFSTASKCFYNQTGWLISSVLTLYVKLIRLVIWGGLMFWSRWQIALRFHRATLSFMTIQCPIMVTIWEDTLLEDSGAERIKALISSYVTNKINS